jgi:multiple sugar transport system permease protein
MERDVDRERRALWLLAAPFLFGVALLVVGPALFTVIMSAFEWDLVSDARFVGAANFRELLGDDVFRVSLRNSLWFVVVSVPLKLLGALGLALLLHRRTRVGGLARGAVVLPAAIPDAAWALVWLWILNPLTGPLNLALQAVGLPTPAWLTQPGAARWGVVLIGLLQLGEGFLIALAARRGVPQRLHETAEAAGAGPWARFVRVTLPLMAPALLLVACRDAVASFQATFVPALLVTGGGPPPHATTFLPLFVYRNAFEYLRYGYAASATVVMIAVSASIVWLMIRTVDRWRGGLVEPIR